MDSCLSVVETKGTPQQSSRGVAHDLMVPTTSFRELLAMGTAVSHLHSQLVPKVRVLSLLPSTGMTTTTTMNGGRLRCIWRCCSPYWWFSSQSACSSSPAVRPGSPLRPCSLGRADRTEKDRSFLVAFPRTRRTGKCSTCWTRRAPRRAPQFRSFNSLEG